MSESTAAAPVATSAPASLRAFRIVWTIVIVLLTTAPYLINWRATPAGYQYTWILPPYPEDSLAYQAWAQQAAHGSLLFQDKYTAVPHAPFLFHPFFLIAGWLGAATGIGIGPVFLALKTLGVILFFLAFYRYLDWLALDRLSSIAATLLVGISSGFGGLIMMSGLGPHWPVPVSDIRLPDLNTFWSLLWNPLFPYSLTLLLLAMFWLDRGTRDGRGHDLLKAGLANGLLALLHPYSQPLVLACAAVFLLARWQRGSSVGLLLRFALATAPFILYETLTALLTPIVSLHNLQGHMNSPALSSYLYSYGLPLIMACLGLVLGRLELARRWWPLLMWFTLSLLFAYLPLWFQRKLVFGSHLPLCLLAGICFSTVANGLADRAMRACWLAVGLFVLLPISATTSYYLLVTQYLETRLNADGSSYVPFDIMAGFKFLKEKSKPSDIVCASLGTSRLIPAFSGNTALWGHWAMAVDSAEREKWFEDIFGPDSKSDDPARAKKFWDAGIRYIFAEGALRRDIEQHPEAWRLILEQTDQVYTNNLVIIYRRRS